MEITDDKMYGILKSNQCFSVLDIEMVSCSIANSFNTTFERNFATAQRNRLAYSKLSPPSTL